jgi:hypothetical protein
MIKSRRPFVSLVYRATAVVLLVASALLLILAGRSLKGILLSDHEFKFGHVRVGQVIVRKLQVYNLTARPVEVTRYMGCGCLVVSPTTQTVAAWHAATISLAVHITPRHVGTAHQAFLLVFGRGEQIITVRTIDVLYNAKI